MNIRHIERMVCDSVNSVLYEPSKGEIEKVCVSDIYKGTTKVPLSVSVARQFCYYVLHDLYHQPYSVIAFISNRSQRSVIGCVAKCRELIFLDDVYAQVFELLKKNL